MIILRKNGVYRLITAGLRNDCGCELVTIFINSIWFLYLIGGNNHGTSYTII